LKEGRGPRVHPHSPSRGGGRFEGTVKGATLKGVAHLLVPNYGVRPGEPAYRPAECPFEPSFP